MHRTFDFINITSPNDSKAAKYRRNVHSQSMRAFRRDQRMRRAQEHNRCQSTELQPVGHTPLSTIESSSPQSDETLFPPSLLSLASVGSYVGVECFDPFASMPLALAKKQQMLVAHFVRTIGPLMVPALPSRHEPPWAHQWLQMAMGSPLLFSATCSHASEHLDAIKGGGTSRLSLHLRVLALHNLSSALKNDETAVANETVASLVALVANGLVSGSAAELTMHLDALNNIVALRGGLDTSSFGGTLRMIAGWHFAPASMLTSLHAAEPLSRENPVQYFGAVDLTVHHNILDDLLLRSRTLSSFVGDGLSVDASPKAQYRDFIEARTTLEHDLVGLWKQLEAYNHISSPSVAVMKCACLAGLLYTLTYLRKYGLISATTKKMTAELLLIASTTNATSVINARERELMFWSLATGTVLSAQSSQRACLAAMMRAMGNLLFVDLDQLTNCLHGIAWPPDIWNRTLRDELSDCAQPSLYSKEMINATEFCNYPTDPTPAIML